MNVGTLQFSSALKQKNLVAPVVAQAITEPDIGAAPIDASLSDTAAFCAAYEVKPEECANCVVLKTKKGEERGFVAVVVLASTRADINNRVCEVLGVKKASFAQMEEAVELTGMEYGAITPIGLPADWPILVDARVAEAPIVIIGSGLRQSKIALSGKTLATLPRVQVIENLATPR